MRRMIALLLGLLGVGCAGDFVELSKVRVKPASRPAGTTKR